MASNDGLTLWLWRRWRPRKKTANVLTFPTPDSGVTIGVPIVIGDTLVVPLETFRRGAFFRGGVEGVYCIVRANDEPWETGIRLYWDADASQVTSHGDQNLPTGYAVESIADDPESTGRISLTGDPMNSPANAPAIITDLREGTAVYLVWSAPSSVEPIINYSVQMRLAAAGMSSPGDWYRVADVDPSETSVTIPGLEPEVAYDFRVRANSESAAAEWSNILTVTPAPVSRGVMDFTAIPEDSSVVLTWVHPDGPPSSGNIWIQYRRANENADWTSVYEQLPIDPSVYEISPLVNGVEYEFRVLVENQQPGGSWSVIVKAVPRGLPAQITDLLAEPRAGSVLLSWSVPDDNGAQITSWLIQHRIFSDSPWIPVSDNQCSVTDGMVECLVEDLGRGMDYEFQVTAVNAAGTGPWSTPAFAEPYGIAGPPINFQAIAQVMGANLTWDPPDDDGGHNISHYVVYFREYETGEYTVLTTVIVTETSVSITTLSGQVRYQFKIAANTQVGIGAISTAEECTTFDTITAPMNVAAVRANRQITVTWSQPLMNGGQTITNYEIMYRPVNTDWLPSLIVAANVRSTILTELTNGTTYQIRLRAVGNIENGEWSAVAEAVPMTQPTVPLSLATVGGNGQCVLTWDPPADSGGAPVTDYSIGYRLSSEVLWTTFVDGVSSDTTATVTGLTNSSQYDFRVAASNVVGTGPWTPAVSEEIGSRPSVPQNPAAVGEDQRIVFDWDAPADSGGLPITDYLVNYRQSGSTNWLLADDGVSTNTTATIQSLNNLTTYDLRVAAVTVIGAGPWTASITAMPITAGYDVIVLAGQSNMRGGYGGGNPNLDPTDPRIQQYGLDSDTVTLAQDPLDHHGAPAHPKSVGPGMSLARAYLADLHQDRKILLSPVAKGGSGFGSAPPAALRWDVPSGLLYTEAVDHTNRALQQTFSYNGSPTRVSDNRVVGIFWQQGERNTSMGEADYQGHIEALIAGLRQNINTAANSRFVAGRIPAWSGVYGIGVDNALVRIPARVNDTAICYTSDLAEGNDGIHFNAPESRILGQRYYDKWINMPLVPGQIAGATFTIVAGDSEAQISWVAPANQSYAHIERYEIRHATAADFSGAIITTVEPATPVPTVPDKIISIEAVLTDNRGVIVSWSPPGDGGAGITGYEVSRSTPAGTSVTITTGPTVTTAIFTSLTTDFTYEFEARAINEHGAGPWSDTVTARPMDLTGPPPGKTGGLTVTAHSVSKSFQWTVTWNTPSTANPITGYDVYYKESPGDLPTASGWTNANHTGTGTTKTLLNLTGDQQYYFVVSARNSIGNGPWSHVEASEPLLYTAPPPPPASGTLDGLTPAVVYYVQVRAVNHQGNGEWSQSKTVTPT